MSSLRKKIYFLPADQGHPHTAIDTGEEGILWRLGETEIPLNMAQIGLN